MLLLLKGEVKTYDMDGFRLHVYLTQDALGDATTVVEGRDGLVILEMPLFKENLKEFAGYLKGLGKPVVKVVADYHVGGVADYAPDQVVLVEGMSEFAKGAVYGGMLEGFKAAFGDAIDLREHAGTKKCRPKAVGYGPGLPSISHGVRRPIFRLRAW